MFHYIILLLFSSYWLNLDFVFFSSIYRYTIFIPKILITSDFSLYKDSMKNSISVTDFHRFPFVFTSLWLFICVHLVALWPTVQLAKKTKKRAKKKLEKKTKSHCFNIELKISEGFVCDLLKISNGRRRIFIFFMLANFRIHFVGMVLIPWF